MKPQFGFLEITSHCNFKCTFCPSELLKRKKSNLNLMHGEKFIQQFSELYPGVPLQLNVLGEPFINKEIFTYFEICMKYHVHIILITNYSLLDDKTAQKLFENYDDFTLVLSLQTPTEESFKMRGCKNYTFEQYAERVREIIELKIKNQCKCSIEIHVASSYHMIKHDTTIQSDVNFDPFMIFKSAEEAQAWHIQYLDSLEIIKESMVQKYADEYVYLEKYAEERFAEEIKLGKIVTEKESVPVNMYEMTEDQLWGYMCMPGVFFRYKTFGMWTKDQEFLKSIYDSKNVFVFVAERTGKMQCSMAENIGMLSNGDFISCCLDYEGEMLSGNIDNTDLYDSKFQEEWEKSQQNVLLHAVCRRCKGDVIIASKEAVKDSRQEVVFFAGDWFPTERDGERIWRWSKDCSTSYVYARLNANYLEIQLESPLIDERVLFVMYSYCLLKDGFTKEDVFETEIRQGKNIHKIPFDFKKDTFYKIEVHTSTFKPCDWNINAGDHRELGICLYGMALIREDP